VRSIYLIKLSLIKDNTYSKIINIFYIYCFQRICPFIPCFS
jgi:hypothetical protein